MIELLSHSSSFTWERLYSIPDNFLTLMILIALGFFNHSPHDFVPVEGNGSNAFTSLFFLPLERSSSTDARFLQYISPSDMLVLSNKKAESLNQKEQIVNSTSACN